MFRRRYAMPRYAITTTAAMLAYALFIDAIITRDTAGAAAAMISTSALRAA